MIINFNEPIHADNRAVRFGKAPFNAENRKVFFRYVIGTLKHYEQAASIGYLDEITIGTLDPKTMQWFSNAIT